MGLNGSRNILMWDRIKNAFELTNLFLYCFFQIGMVIYIKQRLLLYLFVLFNFCSVGILTFYLCTFGPISNHRLSFLCNLLLVLIYFLCCATNVLHMYEDGVREIRGELPVCMNFLRFFSALCRTTTQGEGHFTNISRNTWSNYRKRSTQKKDTISDLKDYIFRLSDLRKGDMQTSGSMLNHLGLWL